jgi:spore coat assembly protein
MEEIKNGDVVGRKSYNKDVFFKVIDIYKGIGEKEHCKLKGLHYRLFADSPLEDLVKIDSAELAQHLREHTIKSSEHMNRIFARRERDREYVLGRAVMHGHNNKVSNGNGVNGFDVPGTVLHIDGDNDYLDLCLTTYRQLNIPADGYNIEEEHQSKMVEELLKKHNPDLLVLTGHDGFIKGKTDFADINNYYSSRFFVEAVRAARLYEKSRDDLVIFAGACQSHYEAILNAGANFASSPLRVMIHAYDPVFVVEKIAYTSIYDPISIKEIITGTITGFNGIGGMETRGKYRFGVPKSPY